MTLPILNAKSVPELIRERRKEPLRLALSKLSSFEIADIISNRAEMDQIWVVTILPPKIAAETFDYLGVQEQKNILKELPSNQAASILTEMSPDDRTALFEDLPRPTIEEYLKLLPPEECLLAVKLLGYPEGSVGRLMTTDYLTVKMDWSKDQVLEHIQAYGHDSETISVIYVVDDENHLIDDIKIRDFFFLPKEGKVSDIVDKKFVALSVLDHPDAAIKIFENFDRSALPVIDGEGILQGIVTIDDIMRLLAEENTEDVQKIGGTEALDESYMETPIADLIKKRARWLVLLFVGEMFTATAMGYYEEEISKAVILAIFIPLIISSGGNAGSQSTTLIIRAMALGEVTLKDWWKVMRREVYCGLTLGLILGLVGFFRVALWSSFSTIYGEHWVLLAFTILFSLIGVVLWGSLIGSMLPIILRRLGFDPATASAPLVATLVDVTGIVIYFGIAMTLLAGTLL